MYSKEESARIKQEFWTSLGVYLRPILSDEGEKVAWLNYKTGEKGIQFRMTASNKEAQIGIEINHRDGGIRELYFEQFLQLKTIFNSIMEEDWTWRKEDVIEERPVARIFHSLDSVNIMKKEDWPKLISFFKPRIIKLDEFWSHAKYSFEALH